uniref:Uncharacterized protein n=1 Tax=Tetranychus urticae TaxID=32264 RepID=T1KTD2_TETUR
MLSFEMTSALSVLIVGKLLHDLLISHYTGIKARCEYAILRESQSLFKSTILLSSMPRDARLA